MNIVFYRYGSIYEPDMIDAFNKAGLNIIEITDEISDKTITNMDRLKLVEKAINKYEPLFVYGINFYPVISEICKIYKTLYICQTVDSPVLTLFSRSITNDNNRIFSFDMEQYNYFSRFNPGCFFHIPLASAVDRFDKVISTVSPADRRNYSYDISFVGSTYREKDPLLNLDGLSEYDKGYLEGLVESSIGIYGYYAVKDAISDDIVSDIKQAAGNSFPYSEDTITSIDKYTVSHDYIASHIATLERARTLSSLGEKFNVRLYTNSETTGISNVHFHEGIRTLDVMPKVFNLSRINLNITMRAIESGLPLRCFDILGCCGFLMTNYQNELDDMFVIGEDLEAYSSIDELTEKCTYYLSHEDQRKRIAISGYEKAKKYHTHYHRLKDMLRTVMDI